jgi:hypothetical protein
MSDRLWGAQPVPGGVASAAGHGTDAARERRSIRRGAWSARPHVGTVWGSGRPRRHDVGVRSASRAPTMAHRRASRASTNPFDGPWQGVRSPGRRPSMAHRRGRRQHLAHDGTTLIRPGAPSPHHGRPRWHGVVLKGADALGRPDVGALRLVDRGAEGGAHGGADRVSKAGRSQSTAPSVQAVRLPRRARTVRPVAASPVTVTSAASSVTMPRPCIRPSGSVPSCHGPPASRTSRITA